MSCCTHTFSMTRVDLTDNLEQAIVNLIAETCSAKFEFYNLELASLVHSRNVN